MFIYPAIDLRAGNVVRLRQGDPNQQTTFGNDPAATACQWQEQGAAWIHVVNLDGALGATSQQIDLLHRSPNVKVQLPGDVAKTPLETLHSQLPINLRRLVEIRRAVTAQIQFGGGLRTLDDVRLAFELGADRVVLGTVALTNPRIVAEALATWGEERIVVGLDAREGKVATHGWQQDSGEDVIEVGHRMAALGVKRVLYTDVSRDGMLQGVNLETTTRLGDLTDLKVIASGGVANIEDIENLKQREHYNIDGVIVGQALYTGALDLAEAIAVSRRPVSLRSAGIVPVRRDQSGNHFLLLYNCFFDQWQFPRGSVKRAESDVDAATRHFDDETHLPIAHLFADTHTTLQYTCFIRSYDIERTILYYTAEIGEGEIEMGNSNHCEARWCNYNEAWELLTTTAPEQLPALDDAQRLLMAGAEGRKSRE